MRMNINIEERAMLKLEWKEVLLECYYNDDNFPNSCDYVTREMLDRVNKLGILKSFKLRYKRGYFIDKEKECDTGEIRDTDNIYKILDCENPKLPCIGCGGCYFMNNHSFIEIIDRRIGEIGVLDFTRYQFETDKFSEWVNSKFKSDEDCVQGLMDIIDFDVTEIWLYV